MPPNARVLQRVHYAMNTFETIGNFCDHRFFTTGRTILAFNNKDRRQTIGVLDTFFGLEFFLNPAEGSEKLAFGVLDCFSVEYASNRTAALVLAAPVLSSKQQLAVQEVEVEYEQKTFIAHPPVVISTDRPLDSFDASRKWLHATEHPNVLFVAAYQVDRIPFYRFTRGSQTVEELPHLAVEENRLEIRNVHVHNGRVLTVERLLHGLELVQCGPWELPDPNRPQRAVKRAFRPFRELAVRFVLCSFVCDDVLYVLLKRRQRNRFVYKIHWISLEDGGEGAWLTVPCMPDLWFNSVACPAVFVDGILCLHPVYKCETKRAFFSFRFPIGRPEFLGYSAWFHVLRAKEDVTVELLRRGACRPLSATGSYLNAISLLDPSHVLIRTKYEEQQLFGRAGGARGEDVFNPPAPKRQKSSELGASWRPHRRIGREQEEKDLEHAIHESLITAAQWREKTRQEPKDELECIGRVSLEAIEDRPGPSGFQPSASAAQSKMDEKDEKEGEDQQE